MEIILSQFIKMTTFSPVIAHGHLLWNKGTKKFVFCCIVYFIIFDRIPNLTEDRGRKLSS